jgi:hypothetical protein
VGLEIEAPTAPSDLTAPPFDGSDGLTGFRMPSHAEVPIATGKHVEVSGVPQAFGENVNQTLDQVHLHSLACREERRIGTLRELNCPPKN